MLFDRVKEEPSLLFPRPSSVVVSWSRKVTRVNNTR